MDSGDVCPPALTTNAPPTIRSSVVNAPKFELPVDGSSFTSTKLTYVLRSLVTDTLTKAIQMVLPMIWNERYPTELWGKYYIH